MGNNKYQNLKIENNNSTNLIIENNVITKINSNDRVDWWWYNQEPLTENSKKAYKFRILQTKEQRILVGVACENFNIENFRHYYISIGFYGNNSDDCYFIDCQDLNLENGSVKLNLRWDCGVFSFEYDDENEDISFNKEKKILFCNWYGRCK